MDFGSYAGYGIPYQVVTASTPRSTVTFDYDEESDHVGYPIPAAPQDRGRLGPPHADGRQGRLPAVRAVRGAPRSAGTGRPGSGATWDLRSNALRPEGWTSADAAGLPILPGLVRYDEVAAGAIHHALRFTTNRTRTTLHLPGPPRGRRVERSTSLPPMGLRVRLKATYDTEPASRRRRGSSPRPSSATG